MVQPNETYEISSESDRANMNAMDPNYNPQMEAAWEAGVQLAFDASEAAKVTTIANQ